MNDLETYSTIAAAIHYLDNSVLQANPAGGSAAGNATEEGLRPTLDEVAEHVGLSPWHLQRLFTRWAGLSPKRYLQALTAETAKRALRDAPSVLDATWQAGLSSPGRLHDLTVSVHGMTPGEIRREGGDLEIRWGHHPSPFGPCFVATTERGMCALRFLGDEGPEEALGELVADWPRARVVSDPKLTARWVEQVFSRHAPGSGDALAVLVRGTNFQIRVWEALLAIPAGAATTYGRIAEAIGRPGAARAVGRAVGTNPVAVIIPCHRVLRSDGSWGGYRWGVDRKRQILAWEMAEEEPMAQAG